MRSGGGAGGGGGGSVVLKSVDGRPVGTSLPAAAGASLSLRSLAADAADAADTAAAAAAVLLLFEVSLEVVSDNQSPPPLPDTDLDIGSASSQSSALAALAALRANVEVVVGAADSSSGTSGGLVAFVKTEAAKLRVLTPGKKMEGWGGEREACTSLHCTALQTALH
jgi:hypothetical protein